MPKSPRPEDSQEGSPEIHSRGLVPQVHAPVLGANLGLRTLAHM